MHDARAIVRELKRYDETLYDKPRWLVLNKLDLIPEEEREARVKAFVKSLRWKGPVFAIAAISAQGCRELTFKIQDWLDEHPATSPALPDDVAEPALDAGTPVVVSPAPVRARRPRTTVKESE